MVFSEKLNLGKINLPSTHFFALALKKEAAKIILEYTNIIKL
jgi:hypothetical protein